MSRYLNQFVKINVYQTFVMFLMSIALICIGNDTFGAEITGTIKDKSGVVVPFVDVILYHQGNHSTTTKTDADGNFALETERNGNVQLTVNRLGYHSNVSTVFVPATSVDPIELEITLKEQDRSQRGSERLLVIDPSLNPGSKLEGFVFPAIGAKKYEWSVAVATQETMFSTPVAWNIVDQKNQEGDGGELYGLVLSDDICAAHEHVKVLVKVKVHYAGVPVQDVVKEKILLISRRSMLTMGKGAN
ncbi:carboxypeptidase-like regulatory domain-containing protein [uncultured Gimesia sp.]|uniref:carboxypeptidase-like regulatory domain-containing protein n=1 Tax=uncultured Gimesia sp. TaxID=1678688 RepID=UPI0030D926F9|tara:strand:+ start:77649 stop:78386 length:738 start_codon:yes stop_codon:yes gene_type:complete